MKVIFKKLLTVFVVVLMLFGSFNINFVYAEDPITITGDYTITMYDGQVQVLKVDYDGNPLAGAKLQVLDGSTVKDSWTSTTKAHNVSNLEEGKTYTLREITSPNNGDYVRFKDVTFKATSGLIEIKGDQTKDGMVTIQKVDGKDAGLSGAEITIYKGTINGFNTGTEQVSKLTTNGNAQAVKNLDIGEKYTAVETKTPINYVQAKNKTFTANNTKQEFKMNDFQVQVNKKDWETVATEFNDRPQGDAVLDDGEWEILDSNGTRVGGVYNFVDTEYKWIQLLKEGETYKIHEIKAPTGYKQMLADVTFTADGANNGAEDNNKKIVFNNGVKSITVKNDVITGTLSIHKTFNKNTGVSSWVEDEEGAKFYVVLESNIDKYRTDTMSDLEAVLAAWEHKDEWTEKEYAELITDNKGFAKSGELAYGDYLVVQVAKTKPEAKLIVGAAKFSVKTEGQENKHYEAVNEEARYYIDIHKVDEETGKSIIQNATEFKLTDADGKEVVMVVGTKFNTFITNSKNGTKTGSGRWVNESDELGHVITPTVLRPGIYTLTEMKNPYGFILADPIEVNVTDTGLIEVAEDENMIAKVDVLNRRAYGELNILKKIEDYEANTSLINREDLSEIKFTLTAAEDIINPIDGEIIVKAEEVYGEYNLNKDGTLKVERIPLGRYILKETYAPAGLVMDPTEYDVIFEQTDNKTETFKLDFTITNKPTKLEVTKQDVAGKELPGARLKVTDTEGAVVDSWTSTEEPHKIEGLALDTKYYLTEDLAPLGYAKATTIEFTVNADGSVTKVNMIDKIVKLTKTDLGGKEVIGAKIKVTDKDGNPVDEWTSGPEPHNINNLEVGKTYIMIEDLAPLGFVNVGSWEFTVTDDGVDQELTMIDTIERVAKVDDEGVFVSGVKIGVFDKDNVLVDSWTTGEHIIDLTEEDVAALDKGETVEKENVKIIPTMIKDAGFLGMFGFEHAAGATVIKTLEDDILAYFDVDLEGNETYHRINHLYAGKDYTIKELETVPGYYWAKDVDITPSAEKDNITTMIDNKINLVVAKISDDGDNVAGAKMKLYELNDSKQYEEIHEWTTTAEEYDISKLVTPGKTYKLVEVETPDGHYTAAEYTFRLPMYGSSKKQTINIVDVEGKINFFKYDPITGNPVKDAKYAIYSLNEGVKETDLEGKTVEELEKAGKITIITTFITTDDLKGQAYDVNGKEIATLLSAEKTYYYQETEAPFGYDIDTEAHAFTMTGDRETVQMVRAYDSPLPLYVQIAKKDQDKVSYYLKGAEISVFKSDGTPAKDLFGKDAVGITDENGLVTFQLAYDPNDTYYIQETKAPKGYQLNKNKFEVKVHESYKFFETDLIEIDILDKIIFIPPTGTGMIIIGAVATLGLAGGILLLLKKKKETK